MSIAMTTATTTTTTTTTKENAATNVRLHVDWTRCDGHGLCHALLSDRIEVDEWGFPIVRDADVAPRDETVARRAVAACPALALSLNPSPSR